MVRDVHRVLTVGSTQRMGDHNPTGRRMWGKGISKNGEEFSRWWEVGRVGRTLEGEVNFVARDQGRFSRVGWSQTLMRGTMSGQGWEEGHSWLRNSKCKG